MDQGQLVIEAKNVNDQQGHLGAGWRAPAILQGYGSTCLALTLLTGIYFLVKR